jgi:ABC-type phosphate transport system substrate-binding protein
MRHEGFYRKLTGLLGVIVIAAGCSSAAVTATPAAATPAAATPAAATPAAATPAAAGSPTAVPLNGKTITWATISGFYTDIAV